MGIFLKNSLEFLAITLAIVLSYYELKDAIPNESLIVFEVEKLQTSQDTPTYSLTGVVADQDYFLESVRIIPYSDTPVTRKTFTYGNYKKEVELTKISTSEPPTYLISRNLLKQQLKEDDSFSWAFLDDDSFKFLFEFKGAEPEKIKFECKVQAIENKSVPCEIKEQDYMSLYRGIPWYFLVIGIGLFIIIIEVFYIWLRNPKKSKKRNQLTIDED